MVNPPEGEVKQPPPHDSVIIECFGMPGAGKTYVSHQLEKILLELGQPYTGKIREIGQQRRPLRIWKKLTLVGLSLLTPRNFKVFWAIIRFTLNSKPKGIKGFFKVSFNWFFIFAFLRFEKRSDKIAVMDQGIFQALWSTAFYSQSNLNPDLVLPFLREFLENLRIKALLVMFVHASKDLVQKRLSSRQSGNSPLDGGDLNEWEHAKRALDTQEKLLKKLGPELPEVHIIHYRNLKTFESHETETHMESDEYQFLLYEIRKHLHLNT